MSDYQTRYAAEQAAAAKRYAELLARYEAVLQAGEAAGYWQTLPNEYAAQMEREPGHLDHMALHREVQTVEGNRFSISTREGRFSACIAHVSTKPRQQGIRLWATDLALDAPTATVAADRPAAIIAKELHRRVIVPGAATATKLREELASRVAMRDALLGHVETLRLQGATLGHQGIGDGEHYEARMWLSGLGGSIRVTSGGAVYVERVTVRVEDLKALVALAKRAE
jgi:hypothetical protein